MWKNINKEVEELTKGYIMLQPLKIIFWLVKSRNVNRDLLKLVSYTAEQIGTWVQVSIFVWAERVDEKDLKCWLEHLHVIELLYKESFSIEDLAELKKRIETFSRQPFAMMVKVMGICILEGLATTRILRQ